MSRDTLTSQKKRSKSRGEKFLDSGGNQRLTRDRRSFPPPLRQPAVSAAADRAVYAAVYWARRRDGAAIREVLAALSDADRVEAIWLLRTCDDLDGLSDDELRARMLGLAGEAPPPGIF